MKKLSIIGTVGLPPKYGGFETFADFLVKKLSNNYNITIFCSSKHYKDREKKYFSTKRIFFPFKANGIQSIPYDILSILISIFISDTLLILGISGCIILPIIKPFHQKKIIVSLGGLEWERDKWSRLAKWFLKLSEKCAINFADIILTDNIAIQDYVKFKYYRKSELIEYGGDQSVNIMPTLKDIKKFSFLKNEYALSISRIEPENNCDLILQAFSELNDIQLIYIGNWDNNKYSKTLRGKYLSHNNIILLDAIYDINVLNLVRSNCTIYVHGHSVGGTNPTLVEAMYVGLPILAFDVNFNRETTQNKALFFNDIKQLQNNVKLLLKNQTLHKNKNQTLHKNIAQNMQRFALKRYNWERIINKYDSIL
ncbi:MAG: DUF1972 domain-containing protein [Planctomycetia bacterium]|nr:DUF1972 domain-containing protein [Planctomycetia bacterium]